jgi:hypothetical protein
MSFYDFDINFRQNDLIPVEIIEHNSLLPLVTSIYDFMLTVIGQSSLLTIFCCLKETVLVSTVGELFNEIMGNSSVKCVDYAN